MSATPPWGSAPSLALLHIASRASPDSKLRPRVGRNRRHADRVPDARSARTEPEPTVRCSDSGEARAPKASEGAAPHLYACKSSWSVGRQTQARAATRSERPQLADPVTTTANTPQSSIVPSPLRIKPSKLNVRAYAPGPADDTSSAFKRKLISSLYGGTEHPSPTRSHE